MLQFGPLAHRALEQVQPVPHGNLADQFLAIALGEECGEEFLHACDVSDSGGNERPIKVGTKRDTIFAQRPIALLLLALSVGLLLLSAASFLLKRRDWRATLAQAEAGET